ncbi:uncharacterized protein [Nicotiana tomentosiformis]|uniref:uncharacterized protein n=1 Tax=Nicotiana tomentosiformis TaxID=4098 RepID=UPI00388C6AA7
MLTREREERETKRSRDSITYNGTRAPATARHGRGYVSLLVHSTLPAARGILTTHRPQAPYYAPPLSSAPPARGAFSGQSCRSRPNQPQQTCSPRACFECGDTHHMVRDFPKLRRGAPPQTTQASRIPPGPQGSQSMVVTPPAQRAIGGDRAGRGRPREGGQAIYYALPARIEEVTSDSVITSIVPVCHRDASVLFDPGSTYSYVSSYFAPHLGVSSSSLSSPVYVSTLVGDSIVVDHFDIILGMDWLSLYHDILDCHAKTMTLAIPGLPQKEWRGALDYVPSRVISFLKAQNMVEKGCNDYLAFARDVSVDTPTMQSVPIARDYPDDTVQHGNAKEVTIGDGNVLWIQGRLCVPNVDGLCELILQEAHSSWYSIHPGIADIYQDLRQHYWWRRMKKDIVEYVSRCLNYQQVKYEHQRPCGLL